MPTEIDKAYRVAGVLREELFRESLQIASTTEDAVQEGYRSGWVCSADGIECQVHIATALSAASHNAKAKSR